MTGAPVSALHALLDVCGESIGRGARGLYARLYARLYVCGYRGARADAHDVPADSDTPIHKAVREGHMELVKLLLRHRADLKSTNIAGLTPLQLAERCKRSQIAALLQVRQKSPAELLERALLTRVWVLQDIETNGYNEEAAAPSKVPAPLIVSDKGSSGALTGGKTFEELMNIKSDPTPTDWETPHAMAPVSAAEGAAEGVAQPEGNSMEGGAETDQLDPDADEPLDFSQVNMQGDDNERAEALLARLELEEASAAPVAAEEPVAAGSAEPEVDEGLGDGEDVGSGAAEEGAEAVEASGEGVDDENAEEADGLVHKKPKKVKKKK
jgi:hypothetical protein